MKSLNNIEILLVDPDVRVLGFIQATFPHTKVLLAKNGDEGLKKFKKFAPNVVITEIVMPIMDGLSMTREIKSFSRKTPVIAHSFSSDKDKLIRAINVRIDRYLIKPCKASEIADAVKELTLENPEFGEISDLGRGLNFDKTNRVFLKGDEQIALTKKELAFITSLCAHPGALVLYEELKNNVWLGERVSEAAIRTFVKRLRDKIGEDIIKNVSGLGYKIETNF